MKGKSRRKLLWVFIISFFGVILIRQQVILNRLNKKYDMQYKQLMKQKNINSKLKEQMKLTTRNEYIVDTARAELNLVKPGEILFIDKNRQK